MATEINVHLVHKPDRRNIYMRYRDPFTGEEHTRTTGTRVEREAERAAARWEKDLRENKAAEHNGRITWAEFRTRFESEHLLTLRTSSDLKASTVLDAVEEHIKPSYLAQLNSALISKFLADLRLPYAVERGKKTVTLTRSESTVAGYRAVICTMLNWAADVRLIHQAPKIPKLSRGAKTRNRSKLMKGRALTDAEYAHYLTCVASVVGEDRKDEWLHYLKGMWLSGLRLEESLELWWDRTDMMHLDFSGEYPMMRVQGEIEKGGEHRLLPITPDFAAFLLETPPAQRTGPVFTFTKKKQRGGDRPTLDWVSGICVKIGRAAKIVVDQKSGKCASIHDFRRSFGARWSRVPGVTPKILMELMRHKDIHTTMKYYVADDAAATAAILWKPKGDSSGDTPPKT